MTVVNLPVPTSGVKQYQTEIRLMGLPVEHSIQSHEVFDGTDFSNPPEPNGQTTKIMVLKTTVSSNIGSATVKIADLAELATAVSWTYFLYVDDVLTPTDVAASVSSTLSGRGLTASWASDLAADALSAATGAATAAAGVTTLLGKLTGITSLANWLRALMRKSVPDATALTEINSGGGTYDATLSSLEAIRARGDAGWVHDTGPTGGADPVTIAFFLDYPANTRPVADADAWVTEDPEGQVVVEGPLQTDSNGKARFMLNAGLTYYAWMQKDGVDSVQGRPFVAVRDEE